MPKQPFYNSVLFLLILLVAGIAARNLKSAEAQENKQQPEIKVISNPKTPEV